MDARVNVFASLSDEASLDRVARQARDVEETCQRIVKLAAQLKVRAQSGDRRAERSIAVLVDDTYEALAVVLLMESE